MTRHVSADVPAQFSSAPLSPQGYADVAAPQDEMQARFDEFGPVGDTVRLEPGWLGRVSERLSGIKDGGKRVVGAVALVGAGLGLGIFGNAVAGESDSFAMDKIEAAANAVVSGRPETTYPGSLAEGLGEVMTDEPELLPIQADQSPAEKANRGLRNMFTAAESGDPEIIDSIGLDALASARQLLDRYGSDSDPSFRITEENSDGFTEERTPDGVVTVRGEAELTTNPLPDIQSLRPVDRDSQGTYQIEITLIPDDDGNLRLDRVVLPSDSTDLVQTG